MPRTYIKIEYFQYIEMKSSVTVDEFAQKMCISRAYAASWLSKWAGKGYLTRDRDESGDRSSIGRKRVGPRTGRYRVGPKWWGELAYGANKEFG